MLPGDWVIIASDGLETLTGDEIATTIGKKSAATPGDLTRRLLDQVDRRAASNQDNTSLIAVRAHTGKAHTGKTAEPGGDRHHHAGKATSTPSDRNRDTGIVASMIHGTLIGEDKNTKRLRRPPPAHRSGAARLAALFVVFALASALFFLVFFEMLASRFSGGPNDEGSEHPPSAKPRSKSR